MNNSLRTVVADDESDMQKYYQAILPRLGHLVVAIAATGRELIEKCREFHPDLVITDIMMPDMDGIDATAEVYRDRPVPIILVSAYYDAEFIHRSTADHVLAYLVKPIRQDDLEPAIAIVMRRFEQLQALRRQTSNPEPDRGEGKLIECTKELLLKGAEVDEFLPLEQRASDQNRKLLEIASRLLTAEENYQGQGQGQGQGPSAGSSCGLDQDASRLPLRPPSP